MLPLQWASLQLLSYSAPAWLAVGTIAFFAARFGGVLGVLAGHIGVAAMIVALDIAWIQSEIHKSDWSGSPDLDFVFWTGACARIVLINSVLLPVSFWGLSRKDSEEARICPNPVERVSP